NQDISFTNKPESVKAKDVIDQKFQVGTSDDTEYLIVSNPSVASSDPAYQQHVQSLKAAVMNLGKTVVGGPVASYVDIQAKDPNQAKSLISADGHTTLLPVPIADANDTVVADLRTAAAASSSDGYTVQLA